MVFKKNRKFKHKQNKKAEPLTNGRFSPSKNRPSEKGSGYAPKVAQNALQMADFSDRPDVFKIAGDDL